MTKKYTEKEIVEKIDQICEQTYKSDEPGAAVIVVQNGKTIFRKGYGLANVELEVPIKPEMVFRIGSITKQFTAVCILMLMEEGKISLGDDITKFLPDYPTQGHKITVEHLLTHTSGIKSYTSMPEWFPLWRKDLTLDELISIFKDQPMEFAPGDKWNYNNSGYVLLGAIIEKASGMTYEEFLNKRIFEPLGMKTACYDNTIRIIKGRVAGYQKGKNGYENAEYLSMSQPHAAGSLAMSVDDLLIWNQNLYSGTVLKPETMAKAHQGSFLNDGTKINYGYGWVSYDLDGHKVLHHGGGINGFITEGVNLINDGIFVAIFTNRTVVDPGPEYVAGRIIRWMVGIPYEEPKAISLTEDEWDEYVGVYQFDATEEWLITREGDHLKIQAETPGNMDIYPEARDKFFIKFNFSGVDFKRDDERKVKEIQINSVYAPTMKAEKTQKSLPEQKEGIKVAADILEKLVGTYEIGPGMSFEISLDAGKLFATVPGQEKAEMFAESDTVFFLKVVAAKFEFEKDAHGKTNGLKFEQGKMKMAGRKIK